MTKKHQKVRRGRRCNAFGYAAAIRDRLDWLGKTIHNGEWARVAQHIRAIESLSGKVASSIEEANARVRGAVLVDEEMPLEGSTS